MSPLCSAVLLCLCVYFLFVLLFFFFFFFFFQAEDGIRDAQESRGLGDVYKRQMTDRVDEILEALKSEALE